MRPLPQVQARAKDMSIEKAIAALESGPIVYEVGFPYHTVERLIELGLVDVSKPRRHYCRETKSWHTVQDVTLKGVFSDRIR